MAHFELNLNEDPLDNGVKERTADIQVAEEFTFSKFMLSDKLLKSLNKMNFIKPSPIQLKVSFANLPDLQCRLSSAPNECNSLFLF